ncbi:hypothetical protein SAMN05216206_3148 [Pseudomonas guineae]|uniref:Uncharacterized protein n=1 Tax=Pseudomonas guineae TaxID=425504 RepID=A0A1I3M2X0_9PSED|nr:hypothetical protein [Pseudomonas guineae]SFI91267.1 hypothetical protein SAMN05216206_3148 [Pseudomonas guineae]
MTAKEAQLTELLSLSTRTLTHLTAATTAMSFELLNAKDNAVRASARKMIERMLAISSELDQQWLLIGQLAGTPVESSNSPEQVELQSLETPES